VGRVGRFSAMVVYSTPVRSESSPVTHNIAARIVEEMLGALRRDKHISKSELIQAVEKHIAALPLYRRTDARDMVDWGDDDLGDDY
jgi:hypothetical protein